MSNTDAKFQKVFEKVFPVIIARNRNQASIIGEAIKYDALGYKAGQVMAQRTDGLWTKYVNGGASGTGVAVAVLLEDKEVETFMDASTNQTALMAIKAEVYKDKLTGLDAAAITQLGKVVTIQGDNVLVIS